MCCLYLFLVTAGIGIGTIEYCSYSGRQKQAFAAGGAEESGAVQTGGAEESGAVQVRAAEESDAERARGGAQGGRAAQSGETQKGGAAEENGETPARIALTFDDGPHPVHTVKLLDGLRERGVKATFFLIGENIAGREDIVAQMEKDGHLIGNHTWSHVKLTDMDTAQVCEEIKKTSALVKSITGHDTEYIRPPFGAWEKELECGFDMFPVLWSIDPLDWTTSNTDQVVEKVVSAAQENDIILLHDCYASSVDAALRIVDLLSAKGFVFVTADELILE